MDDKNELSDIVLEKDDEKKVKAKRVLIIVSILVILFLIVLLSMKLLNKSDDKKTPNLVLPPEPAVAMKKTDKDTELFKQVPIIEENSTKKDNINKIVKNLKNRATEEKKNEENKKENNRVINNPKKEEIKTVVEPIVQQVVKKTTPILKKRKIKHLSAKSVKGIYVQVGATSKLTPSKNFLKRIKNEHFSYKLLPININGKKVTKILVGPFKSRKNAEQNLAKIKKSLNKNAFIYIIK